MSDRSASSDRHDRYRRVLEAAAASDSFAIADLRNACQEETVQFVARVVRQLQEEGVVEPEGPKARPTYRWRRDRASFPLAEWIDARIFRGQMTHSPKSERPRERLLSLGAPALRTAELLAILIRSGRAGESNLQAGENIAARFADRLERLADAGRGELKTITPAVGETAYCQIMAGIELGRRVANAMASRQEQDAVRGSDDAIRVCRRRFARLAADGVQEEFHVLTLDTKNQVLGSYQVSVGLLDQTVVHPREVFRPAIRDAAKAVILVHNHPSGDPTPSDKDRDLTKRLEDSGQVLGIQVLDHIIVARRGAVSMRECDA